MEPLDLCIIHISYHDLLISCITHASLHNYAAELLCEGILFAFHGYIATLPCDRVLPTRKRDIDQSNNETLTSPRDSSLSWPPFYRGVGLHCIMFISTCYLYDDQFASIAVSMYHFILLLLLPQHDLPSYAVIVSHDYLSFDSYLG